MTSNYSQSVLLSGRNGGKQLGPYLLKESWDSKYTSNKLKKLKKIAEGKWYWGLKQKVKPLLGMCWAKTIIPVPPCDNAMGVFAP